MKAKTKRVVTAMLAVVMLLTTLLPLTASAADVTMDLNNCHVSWITPSPTRTETPSPPPTD